MLMYNFFAEKNSRSGNCYNITGSDYNHIVNVLRMKTGDEFLVSENGESKLCKIECIGEDSVTAEVINESYAETELPVKLFLFQGLPKSDKMELIIQKAVELGTDTVVPVEMSRSVVKLDDKKKKSKLLRWQSVCESAAKQSKRNVIPHINEVLSFNDALKLALSLDLLLVPYENEHGMKTAARALSEIKSGMSIGIFIGPEGGFDDREAELIKNSPKAFVISLGKRILRTETAAITALAMCMLHVEMSSVVCDDKASD